MADKNISSLPFESTDADEQKLWSALTELPRGEPEPGMRRAFYQELEHASTRSWFTTARDWLGISNNMGWVTAAASVLLGFGVAQIINQQDNPVQPERLALLEENVALLNRELILDRLTDDSAGKRLQGVYDASFVVQQDSEVAQALLVRATQDRSSSVRSAAIDALGPELATPSVGGELMSLLENAESPIVQMALIDLVLRNGSNAQLEQLLQMANEQRLYPDLSRHVLKSLGRETI